MISLNETCVSILRHINSVFFNLCRVSKNQHFAYAKIKAQTSFEVTAKLISVFALAARIVQSLSLLNSNFKRLVCFCDCTGRCVGPGRKPLCWFSYDGAHFQHSFQSEAKTPFVCQQEMSPTASGEKFLGILAR